MNGRVAAVSLSEQRGVSKHPVAAIELRADWGVVGDAHAGPWHRQVALLAWEDVLEAQARGLQVGAGSFAENIATQGLMLTDIPVGARLQIGTALLEVTQIGKPHDEPDVIHRLVGDSVIPRRGIFGRVLQGGTVRAGDEIVVTLPEHNEP
ncbi:MAG: MOSC domain-containing protein [Anaerolineae bacterium]|jgi:molybdopterin adenylyltransferase